jgi:hypothetical protein
MADARILFPQFRDEQEDSRYPFADSARLLSSERQLDIGRDTFLDASLYVINGDRQAYISAITVTAVTVTIVIGDVGSRTRATGTYSTLNPPANGIVSLVDTLGRPCGMLLSTPLGLSRFAAWPAETHTFQLAATQFVASVAIPAKEPGVRAITAQTGELLTGDVWLVGERGVLIRQDGAGVIRFDVIGEPLFQRYLCDPYDRFKSRRFVKTINGCGPDEFGNFTLTATAHGAIDTILRVFVQDGNIKIDAIGRKVV